MNRTSHDRARRRRGVGMALTGALALTSSLLLAAGSAPAAAASFSLLAEDAGFVTEHGGSAKGDSTLAPVAKYNYSAGYELHYAGGALGPVLAPMLRKNYFVFDLSAITEPIASAKLVLWTGTLESPAPPAPPDPFETYALKESTDMADVLALSAALAGGSTTGEFDSPADPLVVTAMMLYAKLGDGPMVLGATTLSSAMDDSFIEIPLSPPALGYLSLFAGGKLLLAGEVPTAVPPALPQQPFGFTGSATIGGPMTPVLVVTTVPEPAAAWLMLAGAGVLAGLRRRR